MAPRVTEKRYDFRVKDPRIPCLAHPWRVARARPCAHSAGARARRASQKMPSRPRLAKDALNNRDRHRRAQPLPGRAPARAALQSQWAVLPTRHGCARRGIRGTLTRKSYLFFCTRTTLPVPVSLIAGSIQVGGLFCHSNRSRVTFAQVSSTPALPVEQFYCRSKVWREEAVSEV